MSERDFSGRFPAPVTARPCRPLSIKASTDSCNIRFSFRMITSGVFNCKRLRRRLFRLITRRYKSFRSDVAKRPPSSGTKGRRSGGMTGRISKIIHSGRDPAFRNPCTSFNLFATFFRVCLLLVVSSCCSNSVTNSSKSIFLNTSRIASAPILATKESPNCSCASRYSVSVKSCFGLSGVFPSSITR